MTVTRPGVLPFRASGGLLALLDPGRSSPDDAYRLAERAADAAICGFLVGDSLSDGRDVAGHVAALRAGAPAVPIVQFPAAAHDLSAAVDAVLFLVLLSGRNPQYLIEEQVRAIPFFERHPEIAAVGTAYLLVDGGRDSTVQRATGTRPFAADDARAVTAHVRAGMLMGLQATYLEAGSGAARPVSPRLIGAARAASDRPLIVGGGITTAAQARDARRAGADYIVVGTRFERDPAAAVATLANAARS